MQKGTRQKLFLSFKNCPLRNCSLLSVDEVIGWDATQQQQKKRRSFKFLSFNSEKCERGGITETRPILNYSLGYPHENKKHEKE